jgi:alpha-N-arabinofuranosidase
MNAHAETELRFRPRQDGDKAGLVALQNDAYYYFVGVVREHGRTELHVERRAGPDDPKDGVVIARAPLSLASGKSVYLAIDAKQGCYSFRYALTPGTWRTLLANADGSTLSTKTAGGFVGTLLGVYATSPGS